MDTNGRVTEEVFNQLETIADTLKKTVSFSNISVTAAVEAVNQLSLLLQEARVPILTEPEALVVAEVIPVVVGVEEPTLEEVVAKCVVEDGKRKKEIDFLTDKASEIGANVDEQQDLLNGFVEKLKDMRSDLEGVVADTETTTEEMEKLETQMAELNEKVEDFEGPVSEAAFEDLKSDVENVDGKVNDLSDQSSEIEALDSRVGVLEDEIESMETRYKNALSKMNEVFQALLGKAVPTGE